MQSAMELMDASTRRDLMSMYVRAVQLARWYLERPMVNLVVVLR